MTNSIVPYTVNKIMDIVVSIIFKFWIPFPTRTTFMPSLNAINKILEYNKSHVHHKKWPSKPGYAEGWKVDVPSTRESRTRCAYKLPLEGRRSGRGIQTTPYSRQWSRTGQGRPRWTNNPLELSRQSRAPLCLHLWRYILLRRRRDRRQRLSCTFDAN